MIATIGHQLSRGFRVTVTYQPLAEIKNKHNTMNAKTRKVVTQDLETVLETKRNWTAYLVIIIPKPQRYKRRLHMTRPLFDVDGASFYELVTVEPAAIRNLFSAVIDILNSNGHRVSDGAERYCRTVFDKSMPD